MSKLAGSLPIRPRANLIWPLAVAGIAGLLLLMADLQPVHYFSAISVSIIISFFIDSRLRKVEGRSIVKRSLLIVVSRSISYSISVIPEMTNRSLRHRAEYALSLQQGLG